MVNRCLNPPACHLFGAAPQRLGHRRVVVRRVLGVVDVVGGLGQLERQLVLSTGRTESEVIRAIWCSGSASHHNPRRLGPSCGVIVHAVGVPAPEPNVLRPDVAGQEDVDAVPDVEGHRHHSVRAGQAVQAADEVGEVVQHRQVVLDADHVLRHQRDGSTAVRVPPHMPYIWCRTLSFPAHSDRITRAALRRCLTSRYEDGSSIM